MVKRFPFHRGSLAFVHDLAMAAASFVVALYLRLGDDWRGFDPALMLPASLGFAALAGSVFLSSRMYKGVWRYASVNDLVALLRAVTLAIAGFYLLMFLATRLQELPRSVPVIHWFVLVTLLGGPRFAYRSFKDRRMLTKHLARGDHVPVLLVGAGDDAELFIRATMAPDAEYRAVGILGSVGGRVGRGIHGVDVLGSIGDLDTVVSQLQAKGEGPRRLIITDPRLDGAVVRRLLDESDRLGLPLARIPRLTDLQHGISDQMVIRPIAVEDLLGRPQITLDRGSMEAMIKGSRVLVTGSGGSIGSELARQIAGFGPEALILLDSCEFNLYTVDQELSKAYPALRLVPCIGDVRDAERIGQVMAQHGPALVFHAAALKHVPMVEYNPDEGVLTNAVGTRIVADACRANGVTLMVQISTDKAVNPTNVMGASKRIAEMYTQALDVSDGTRFVSVRFGNVLGSTGSVVPLFQRQLAEGGPLTVTHPDMTRYFMTVREAVELVLQASAFGMESSQYRGKIFVLDMGEPVKIVHLARQMIRLAGLRPDVDVKIDFTGLRPGEKLFEEIFHGAEPPVPTERQGILVAAPRMVDAEELGLALDDLAQACRAHRPDRVMPIVRNLVPEYTPTE
ncbi:Capsular polysaccharide biosynthesis protein CapD [Candidatus Terasakiella magnetica]|nr:Capsular polysaccharide biosynthesis protein CapD [Candidatus Terasakiella magnetica]